MEKYSYLRRSCWKLGNKLHKLSLVVEYCFALCRSQVECRLPLWNKMKEFERHICYFYFLVQKEQVTNFIMIKIALDFCNIKFQYNIIFFHCLEAKTRDLLVKVDFFVNKFCCVKYALKRARKLRWNCICLLRVNIPISNSCFRSNSCNPK
jgi:hypothetical protein